MNDLLSYLVQELPDALRFLEHCVSLESPSFDKPLVDVLVQFIGSRFANIGGNIEYVQSDRFGNHLLARFPGKTDRRILLLGHTDTVWPAGETGKRPFKVDGGKAFGPGVFDMKSGIVLIWMALRALKNTRGGLTNPVTVLLNSDEEVGSNSSRALIELEASACCAVFVMEPSLPEGVLKTARKGVGHFTVKAIGKAAHAGIDPLKGINAVEEIARQIIKLQQMSDIARGTTVTVGIVKGGTRSNVVPAEAAADVDVRITSLKEADRITAAIKALTAELPGARLEIRGSINRPPMERSSDTVRLLDVARRVGAQIGVDIKEGSTGGASDGNLTSALGIPTLDGLGAVGDGAHAMEEWVEINSLPQRAALVAGLIEDVSN
jgi:glutamate carboxypeptidase